MLFVTPRLQPCPRAIAPGCTCNPASCKGGPYRYIGMEIIQVIHLYICCLIKIKMVGYCFCFSADTFEQIQIYSAEDHSFSDVLGLYKPKVDSQNFSTCAIYIFFRTQPPHFFAYIHDLIIRNPNVSRMKSFELSMFHHFCPITSSDINFFHIFPHGFPQKSTLFPMFSHGLPHFSRWQTPLPRPRNSRSARSRTLPVSSTRAVLPVL